MGDNRRPGLAAREADDTRDTPLAAMEECVPNEMFGEEKGSSAEIAQTALASASQWSPILSHITCKDDSLTGRNEKTPRFSHQLIQAPPEEKDLAKKRIS